jgi:ribosomal protein S7
MEQKRTVSKDFNLYDKFLGFLIKKGNKNVAKSILEKALIKLSKKLRISKNIIFLRIFFKLNTFVEVRKIKIRNRSYFVPFSLSVKRRAYLVIKWLLLAVKENKAKISMSEKLYLEIDSILTKQNCKTKSFKIFNNNQAFLNRANSHYRW